MSDIFNHGYDSFDFEGEQVSDRHSVKPNKDYHVQRASKHFNIPEDEVTPEQRRVGKSLNFYDIYVNKK